MSSKYDIPPAQSFFFRADGARRAAVLMALLLIGFLAVETAAGEQPVIKSFNITPQEIVLGSDANLSWSVVGAASIYIDQDVGVVPANGSRIVSPAKPTDYTLVAINGTNSTTASVEVNVVRKLPAINSFMADPEKVGIGEMTNLSWNITGANLGVSIDQGIGNVSAEGNVSQFPIGTIRYTLNATNESGSITETVVVGCLNPAAKLTANNSRILCGDQAVLEWNVTQANRTSFDQGIGRVDSNGSRIISPETTTTYTLTASNTCGDEVTNSTTVEVYHDRYLFVKRATDADWQSPAGSLPFGGSKDSQSGSAAIIYGQMTGSDSKDLLLWTHPSWESYGYIEGIYNLGSMGYAIDQRDHISGTIGTLADSSALTGCGEVIFKVILRANDIADFVLVGPITLNCRDSPSSFNAYIPPQFSGRPVSVILKVEAGESSNLDHAVWKDIVLLRG
jgi:hypothetical protein